MEMNLQLHHEVSDITGKTGLQVLQAIMFGERAPTMLATCRADRCKSSEVTIRQALGAFVVACRVSSERPRGAPWHASWHPLLQHPVLLRALSGPWR